MSDGWNRVNKGGGTIVKVGEGDGFVREVVGVYAGVRQGDYGPLHDFKGEDGEEFSVPHSKALDDLDPDVFEGKLVRLAYQGTVPTKKGGTFKRISIDAYEGEVTEELAAKYPSLSVTEADGEDDQPF